MIPQWSAVVMVVQIVRLSKSTLLCQGNMEVLTEDVIFVPPNGERTTILHGHPRHVKI